MPATYHLQWGAEALWQQLEPLLPGLSVEVVAQVASTNTELLERARRVATPRRGLHSRLGELDAAGATPAVDAQGLPRRQADTQPCLLVAEHQSRGRGRQGKDWQSGAGASLTFSLALVLAPADWSGLSLAVGLALADALDPPSPGQRPRLGIKWPNDLLLIDDRGDDIGRKLGGILIETVSVGPCRMAVVGVGLNVLPQPAESAAPDLSWGYACLQELAYGLTAPAALAQVAAPLVHALLAFEREGFAPLRQRFAGRDLLAGRSVATSLPGLPHGVADGVDESGTLWLRVADGSGGQRRQAVASGEVSLQRDRQDGVLTQTSAC